MRSFLLRSLSAGILVMLTSCFLVGEESAPAQAKANDDVQDFVFLTEDRPLLVRLQVRVDGKPMPHAWDDFMKYLFAYLDMNGDGVLNKQEAQFVPNTDQLTAGGLVVLAGMSAKGSMEELDANKDGKATLDELKAYYRKKKFTPFHFQLDMNAADPLAQVGGFLGNYRPEPEVGVVSQAIFDLLDANKDGKLTKSELAAAQPALLALDENEDETVTTKEIVPDAKPKGGMMAPPRVRRPGKGDSAGSPYLVPIAVRGEAPPELGRFMQERYGSLGKGNKPPTVSASGKGAGAMPKSPPPPAPKQGADPKAKPKEKKPEPEQKLSRKQLPRLDEAEFARLDANKDGILDGKELAAIVQREPDLCLTASFGDKAGKALDMTDRKTPLADKVCYQQDSLLLFDLDKTRMELRRNEEERKKNFFADIIRGQISELFKAADKDGDGFVDEKEAKANPQFSNIFKALDRDGNGKVSTKEMLAYFDKMQEIQQRARAACVTLVLRDQSRGLFELLDTNRDGWLGLRELRQAPKVLERVLAKGKDYLTKDDMPPSYLLTLRRGTAESDGLAAQEAVFNRLYGLSYDAEAATGRGPVWFRKMDKNRDGDVSRKEFLFSDELFRKIDADGDGLISVEEAEKAGEVSR
jgi:Ca2+-binding EF-hand superfamily protein